MGIPLKTNAKRRDEWRGREACSAWFLWQRSHGLNPNLAQICYLFLIFCDDTQCVLLTMWRAGETLQGEGWSEKRAMISSTRAESGREKQ